MIQMKCLDTYKKRKPKKYSAKMTKKNKKDYENLNSQTIYLGQQTSTIGSKI